ncbi:MAG: hypothetical protein GY849_08650 [Deltaproteobacteria bacterium]|nr:hypothetical protein [Deltaproteobacteria bacterium]
MIERGVIPNRGPHHPQAMATGEYNRQQMEAFLTVRRYLEGLSPSRMSRIKGWVRAYLTFRGEVAQFQKQHFSEICTYTCFTSQTSACCGREGIATFFADVVINVLLSSDREVDVILETLSRDFGGFKCVYLKEQGCLWRLKPIVCEMFLCKRAKDAVLEGNRVLGAQWDKLRRRERRYTWPNRPVLFDRLEELFVQAGLESPLMYFHRSPGLLRVKKQFLKKQGQ